MTGDRVLLVDDEEEFVRALAKRLRARGLEVDTAESGHRALEMAAAADYDVVVLDLAMPGIDGLETLRRLKESRPELQVLLLTGHGSIESGIKAMKTGAADFLQKPADFTELLEKIRQAGHEKTALVEKRQADEIADLVIRRGW